MKKTVSICASLIMLVAISFSFKAPVTAPDKITICHMPPGNQANCQEISISLEALNTHIDHHGDALVCHSPETESFYVALSRRTGLTLYTSY